MNAVQQLSHVVNVLRAWRHDHKPADQVLAAYTRARKEMGARDRRMVGDAFFALLRLLRRIDRSLDSALESCPVRKDFHRAVAFPCDLPPNDRVWANPGSPARIWGPADDWIDMARAALAANAVEPGRLKDCMPILIGNWPCSSRRFGEEWLTKALSRTQDWMVAYGEEKQASRLALRASMPDWLWGQMGYGLPPKELADFASSLADAAPVAIRVRGGASMLDRARAALEAAGIEVSPGRIASGALILGGRLPRGGVEGFTEGEYEFQDEGSQMLTELLAPSPGDVVIDACAGGGGKTLHLAEFLGGGATLHAHEPVEARRENLRERLARAGVEGVHLLEGPAGAPPADLVFIDAPCSGLGTVRRSPDLKWRLSPDVLAERIRLQRRILREWAPCVRPGGRLAYATCSLLPDENTHQVQAFLAESPDFSLESPAALARERGLVSRQGAVQFFPHRHGTDGFFMAVLRRSSD